MKSTRKVVTTASVLFAAAAFGGLMAGSVRASAPAVSSLSAQGPISIAGTAAPAVHNVDAHMCKGLNNCKGQGGCASSDNGCVGKNSCKGKGGCRTTQI